MLYLSLRNDEITTTLCDNDLYIGFWKNYFPYFYIFLSAKHQKFSLNLQIYCLEIFYGFDRPISRSKTANLFAVFFPFKMKHPVLGNDIAFKNSILSSKK